MFNLRGPQGQNPRTTVWESLYYGIKPETKICELQKNLIRGIKVDKTVPGLQTSQKNNGGDFLITLKSSMPNGKSFMYLGEGAKPFGIKMITCCCGRYKWHK
jgi:hypothetical protein